MLFYFLFILNPLQIFFQLKYERTIYNQLKGRLHRNVPQEKWPDQQATAGWVSIYYKEGENKDYLIFNEEELAERLFTKARENSVPEEIYLKRLTNEL